jgi:hypothetical protein
MTKDEALKLALEALQFDGFTPEDLTHRSFHVKAITAIKQARSALVQEPVANIRTWHKNGEQHAELWNWDKGIEGLPDGEHNLYTTPPAQEFVCSTGLCHYKANKANKENT